MISISREPLRVSPRVGGASESMRLNLSVPTHVAIAAMYWVAQACGWGGQGGGSACERRGTTHKRCSASDGRDVSHEQRVCGAGVVQHEHE